MIILEILKTILIGIIEGITERLPVSSTGPLILVDEFVQLRRLYHADRALPRLVLAQRIEECLCLCRDGTECYYERD